MPKFSIITVNLNNGSGLCETIESVISQTCIDYEYIVIDGGSTDGSLDLIKEYARRITYWVSEPDGGIYNAMNKGVLKTNGEWIIFMNSGDIFKNNNVLQQLFSIEIHTLTQIVYGNTIVKNKNIKITPPANINKNFFFFDTICHQSLFFKRSVFEVIGYHNLNYKIISDREFLMRAMVRNLQFAYIDIDMCIWESEGLSLKNLNLFHKEQAEMRNIYFNILEIFLLRVGKKISLVSFAS